MKQIRFDNNRTSSGRDARTLNLYSLATQHVFRRIVAICLFVLVSAGAWAADYVIKSGNYYIGMNAAGNALEAKNVVDESCIWTTASALSSTSQSVQNKKNTGKYLVASCTRSGTGMSRTYTWTLSVGNSSVVWRGDNGNFYAYYVTTGGSSWYRSASLNVTSAGITLADNSTTNSRYRSVTQGTDDGATYYQEATGQYVITSANAHFLGGTSTADIAAFSPSTCLWTGTSGDTWENSAGYYLRYSSGLSLSAYYSTNWTISNTYRLYYDGYTDRYLCYDSGWTTNTSSSNNDQYNLVYPVTKRTYLEQSTNPTISGDATFTAKGSKTYSSAGESYIPEYINYIFYNNSDHYFKTDNSTALSAKPTTSESFTYAWSLSANASGHVTVDDDGLVSYNSYYDVDTEVTLTLTATSESGKVLTATKAIMFESPKADPTGITATIDKSTIYVGGTGNVSYTLQGTPCYDDVTFSSSNTSVATVDEHTGVVTAVGVGSATITATAHPYTAGGTNKTATVTVTVKNKVATPVITFTPTSADGGNTAKATIDCSTEGATVSYSINDGTWTTYPAGGFTVNNLDVVKAKAVMANNPSWDDSEIATVTYSKQKVPTPTINVSGGSVTFSCEEPDVTFYYTIGASPADPTVATGTEWEEGDAAITGITNEHYIKVIATKSGFSPSGVASRQYIASSGTSDDVVILNDYEDHNWTYYQSNDKLPTGYPTGYLNSPDPRNVKITYRGGGVEDASSVAISGLSGEGQNTMVYYKTLEKHDLSVKDDGNYAYTVISNPFSKRPKKGSTYYGFAGWKVISGAEYIQRATGKTTPVNNTTVLDLDETIHFVNMDNGYTPNCTSAEVVFEATWTAATVKNLTSTSVPTFSDGTYETNFLLLGANVTNAITISSPCTLMARNPDGTIGNYNNYTIRGVAAGTNNVKLEYIQMNLGMYTNAYVKAEGYNFTIGRGVNNTLKDSPDDVGGFVYGLSSDKSSDNTLKIESGQYYVVTNFGNLNASAGTILDGFSVSSDKAIDQLMILGCDYDRAKNDNSRLNVYSNILTGNLTGTNTLNRSSGNYYVRYDVKSGNLCSEITVKGNNGYTGGINNNFYTSIGGNHQSGRRLFLMEGGRVSGIAGGQDAADSQNTTDRAVDMRIRGTAQIDGNVYGAAEYAGARGIRTMVFTGGTINGWIAGGANGTQSTGGLLEGSTYLYVGGNTTVKSDPSYPNQVMNRAVGGNVFGAGCGYDGTSSSGKITLGTNVVVSDEAYVERGVYGGGSYGFCADDKTSSLFILGGTVAGKSGGVNGANYDSSVQGGVYGGACQNVGGSANIYMDGGIVETGLYGGSNKTGTLSGSVTMQINGGQVGTASSAANIHGGGYGKPTVVKGNVDITLGVDGSEADADGVTIYGDVYGGSALGSVNGTSATTTYKTNVTLNAGTIHGSLYGGGLGNSTTAANVYGPVAVTVNGGSVLTTDGTGANGSGAVYGCNNINGKPQRAVTVDIYGTNSHDVGSKATDPADDKYAIYAVYGGGNQASYTYTETGKVYPQVTVHGCDNSIEYVYGGGNAANVPATQVTIWGGNRIGNVFGGGHGDKNANPQKEANVTGNTEVNIYGGTIGKVFAGSNSKGTIGGASTVNVNKDGDCAMHIDEVYGGGNEADGKAGTINIDCTGDEGEGIGTVYGGANDANIGTSTNKSNIVLNITGGSIDNVFGGNNNGGNINGTIAVNVDWATGTDACGYNYLGNVYGAGNKADYTGNPVVNVKNGTVTGNVFGGGLSAKVTGNTDVEVTGGEIETAVYGGGALADVTGNTTVNLLGGTVNDVYGGGLGRNASGTEGTAGYLPAVAALVGGNTNVTLGGTVSGNLVGSVVTGSIFGCNNVNGTPQGHAKVTIQKTTELSGAATDAYHVAAVYGGGNQAAYIPTSTTDFAEVLVSGCDNSIEYVYGGGNAASTPATKVTIEGGKMYYVFGGGNGKTEDGATTQNPGADVGYKDWTYDSSHEYGAGTTNVNIYGGTITSVFGGSNTKGNIREASNVTLDDNGGCDFEIGDVYGAGNEAEMYGNGNLTIGCIPGLDEIYGGAKNADINGNVSITITNGEFGKVFGGNNLGGKIKGSVTVNIEETGCRPIIIGELYGGGNLAAYTAPTDKTYGDNAGKYPMVNVKSFTSIGTVYGAGLGMSDDKIADLSEDDLKAAAKALGKTDAEIEALSDDALKALTKPYFKAKGVVYGSPQVNIGLIEGKFANGGSYGSVTFPAISNKWNNKLGTIGTVYGGGNAANVEGDTYVNIGTVSTINLVSGEDHSDKEVQGVNIEGNVYGGGNAADVTGKTHVQIGPAKTTSNGE